MSTVSNKNIGSLCDKFVTNYKAFESYIKHCTNLLRDFNWLRVNQFNSDVDDFTYIQKVINTVGYSIFSSQYYEQFSNFYNSEVMNVCDVKTNVLYYDTLPEILSSLSRINLVLGSGQHFLPGERLGEDSQSFNRMYCKVFSNGFELDDREYTFDELYELVSSKLIYILDSYVESENINKEEFFKNIESGKWFMSSTILEPLMLGDKTFRDYISAKTDFDRKVWFFFNCFFCKFIREKVLTTEFLRNDFDNVSNHIEEVVRRMKKKFKNKSIPEQFRELLEDTLFLLEDEKYNFSSNGEIGTAKVKINIDSGE